MGTKKVTPKNPTKTAAKSDDDKTADRKTATAKAQGRKTGRYRGI